MVNTINPAECDRTTVYTGECRNFQDTEWIRFDSGRRRSPNAHDGNEWLLDVGVGSIWTDDDRVRNLVCLVPAREVTRDDLPPRRDLVALMYETRPKKVVADLILNAVMDHLNANGGVPASCEDAALADRLERQAATISELQGSFLRVERDAARWRRAHAIVEQERETAREALDRACLQRNQARTERDEAIGYRRAAETERDDANAACRLWLERAATNAEKFAAAERERDEAAEACATPAVTRADIEKAIRSGMSRFAAALGEQCITEAVDAVHALVSGDDPAVFVVRESDVAAVKVAAAGQRWRAGDTGIPLAWKANTVREKRDECATEWAELEAIARAIDAGQDTDPVGQKAAELFGAAFPGEAFDQHPHVTQEPWINAARHVLGQEASDERP